MEETSKEEANKKISTTSILLISIAAVVIILLVIIVFMYTKADKTAEELPGALNASVSQQAKSPKETFLDFQREFDSAASYNELLDATIKYGSQGMIQKSRASAATDEQSKNFAFSMVKSTSLTSAQMGSITESINENTASLAVVSIDGKTKGAISMVKEGNAWKIDDQNWVTTG